MGLVNAGLDLFVKCFVLRLSSMLFCSVVLCTELCAVSRLLWSVGYSLLDADFRLDGCSC
jgi:hypothetical protein